MPQTNYSNQTSQTSGTSSNITGGDRYTRQMLPLAYAAGGYNKKSARVESRYAKQLSRLDYKLSQGKIDQAKYDQQFANLQEKRDKRLAQMGPSKGEAALQQMIEDKPVEFYPDQAYVDQDPYTLAAIEQRAQMAQEGGLAPGLSQYVSDTLGGKYFAEQNPYLQGMYQDAAGGVTSNYLNTVLPQLEARFAGAGGRGGAYEAMLNASNQGLADELSGMASNLYGTAYMQERDLMQQAAGLSPAAQQMGFYNLDELSRAGKEREDFERTKIQDLMDRFYHGQNQGFNELNRMLGASSQLPMAVGSGETEFSQRTVGSGQQQYPSPKDNSPAWWQSALSGMMNPIGSMFGGK